MLSFQYPDSLAAGRFKVTSVRDLTTGYDSSQASGKAVLPIDPKTNMITFQVCLLWQFSRQNLFRSKAAQLSFSWRVSITSRQFQ